MAIDYLMTAVAANGLSGRSSCYKADLHSMSDLSPQGAIKERHFRGTEQGRRRGRRNAAAPHRAENQEMPDLPGTARGFRAMQFNFVVSTNGRAIRLWESFGPHHRMLSTAT